jgi:hypothetical protein
MFDKNCKKGDYIVFSIVYSEIAILEPTWSCIFIAHGIIIANIPTTFITVINERMK